MSSSLLVGDCRAVMASMPPDTFDSIVTDPPYGLAFMGKAWDHGVPGVEFWTEALRVAKPGAHLVAFGGTRTHHRLMCAIEDAGWEIRDCLMWIYGSGFPKSLDVSKAIDKAAGQQRERIRGVRSGVVGPTFAQDAWSREFKDSVLSPEPITDLARQWDGWGTALKPAYEPIILARKPLAGTVAANVTQYGTGALNIDGTRIAATDKTASPRGTFVGSSIGPTGHSGVRDGASDALGRWPANVVLDEDAAALLDEMSGERGSTLAHNYPDQRAGDGLGRVYATLSGTKTVTTYGDTGGASRFFYTAKSSRAERTEGGAPSKHPTVKPVALMTWLVRLVTPPRGHVLDPFMGTGTTGIAAFAEGCEFTGIELDPEYIEIARQRLGLAAA